MFSSLGSTNAGLPLVEKGWTETGRDD